MNSKVSYHNLQSEKAQSTEGNYRSNNLDWDALEVALTRLDHSPQNFKASIGRSGALSNRRPPSRSSRASSQAASRKSSSAESISQFNDFAGLDEDYVTPKVVHIKVHLEEDDKVDPLKDHIKNISDKTRPLFEPVKSDKYKHLSTYSLFERKRKYPSLTQYSSTPLLNLCDRALHDSDIVLKNIKNIKNSYINFRENKSEGHQSSVGSNFSVSDRGSECSNRFPLLEKEGYDNVESSSETEVIISDRESIADSGIVNRKTVIKINEKSKSVSHLEKEETKPHWFRELQERRSLRNSKDFTGARIVPIELGSDFSKGINVSIKNKPEDDLSSPREAKSRMFVRQGDSDNRPTRASAFNVRRTIEKRQIQQERRERKALREQLREHLRSLSEGRHRRESSCSSSSSYQSSGSIRSKSLNSLDQDQDEDCNETPLFKVQSSPTLECEKNEVRSYLFGSNLSDSPSLRSSKLVSRIMSPTFNDIKQSEVLKSRESNLNSSYNQYSPTVAPPSPNIQTIHNFENNNSWKTSNNFHQQAAKFSDTGDIHATRISSAFNSINSIKSSHKNSSDPLEHPEILSREDPQPKESPIPPPRRRNSGVSRSTGQLTVEQEDKPAWLRLAKERRSLRSPKQLEEQFSDRASSIVTQEPEWVARARRKLESMNVCLTSTTDAASVTSQVTESSSAWSRGGLDALDDLREEVTRISEELSEEASEKVSRELGVANRARGINMIEYRKSKSREASAERQKVSFDATATQKEKPKRTSPQSMLQKDAVKFGDLKHDWGGAQIKSTRTSTGKHKEMRFGEVSVQEAIQGHTKTSKQESSRKFSCPDNLKINSEQNTNGHADPLPVMHFGDTPQDIFTKSTTFKIKSQSSSKFESIAGPDPMKMTAEELNQNVEEYDFPIPTGNEDATELINILKESLLKQELVPEVISNEDMKPKPRSILKRSSAETADIDIKNEDAQTEISQTVKPFSSFKGDTANLDCDGDMKKFEITEENKTHIHNENIASYGYSPYRKHSPIANKKTVQKQESKPHHNRTQESDFNPSIKLVVKEPPSEAEKTLSTFLDQRDSSGFQELPEDLQSIKRRADLFGRRSLRESSRRFLDKRESPDASPESKKREVYHHKPKEVYLEIVDQQRHSLPASLEKGKNRRSLFEWEAIQRQRIEEEERNRYNKTQVVNLKPVSSKIKDLVKLHSVSTLKSIFSKDKRSGYNGTVDGKEDILFQKIPGGNSDKISSKELLIKPMKSPYVIKKILYPEKLLEKEWLSRDQPGLIGSRDPQKKVLPPSNERETYSFNQRNIYIDDENLHPITSQSTAEPSNQTKLSSQNHSNILINVKNNLTKVPPTSLMSNENVVNTKSPQVRKVWLNNLLNNLPIENEKEKINFDGDTSSIDERVSIVRRSFHEYPSRKLKDKLETSPTPKMSYDDQTGLQKVKMESTSFRDRAPRLYEKRKVRSPTKPIEIKDYISPSSSNISSPPTSPSRSPNRRTLSGETISKVHEIKLNSYTNFLKEKENIRPLKEGEGGPQMTSSSLSSNNQNNFDANHSRKEILGNNDESVSLVNSRMTTLSDLNDLNRRSFSKTITETSKDRCISPCSDRSSIYSRESSPFQHEPFSAKLQRERTYSFQSNSSIRSTPERESRPVSLSSILERDVASPYSSTHKLSISEELSEITQKYRKESASRKNSNDRRKSDDVFNPPDKPMFLFGMPKEQNNNTILIKSPRERLRTKSPSFRERLRTKSPSPRETRRTKSPSPRERLRTKSPSPIHKRPDNKIRRVSSKDSRGSQNSLKITKKQLKECHIYNSSKQPSEKEKKPIVRKELKYGVSHSTMSESSKPHSKLVRRKSSLKKVKTAKDPTVAKTVKMEEANPDFKASLRREKKNKPATDSNSERYESIKHKPGGVWTKTSIRRMRLESDSSDKSSIKRDGDKLRRERSFKTEASRALEKWAAGTQVPGKIVKKEGQRYSHQIEEEEKGGQKTSKAISRRIVRRGSRRLSAGGELVSETKEMASSGDPSRGEEDPKSSSNNSVVKYIGEGKDGVSRKLKTSTDGERYVTQSVHTTGGVKKMTTEGVDNKTTKSKEIIGGLGWEGEREVAGRHGEKIVVEHSIGGGRPSTVIKKATSQSKFIITKTKKIVPNSR